MLQLGDHHHVIPGREGQYVSIQLKELGTEQLMTTHH